MGRIWFKRIDRVVWANLYRNVNVAGLACNHTSGILCLEAYAAQMKGQTHAKNTTLLRVMLVL